MDRWPSSSTGSTGTTSCRNFDRDGHNSAVVSQRAQSDDTNNVFSSYSSSGTSAWANNWTTGLDLTGIGWNSNQAGTLISPQHVVMATHYPVAVGGTIVFTDRDGTPHARTLTGRVSLPGSGNNTQWGLYDTDISVGVIDQPIFDVSFYRVMSPHPTDQPDRANGYGSYQQLIDGALFVTTNHSRQAFLRRTSSVTPAGATTYGVVGHSRATGLNPAWTMDLISGDSGHPSFFPTGGELLLMGTHTTTGGFPYLANPEGQAAINAAMTTLGGGPYQLETVDARPRVG